MQAVEPRAAPRKGLEGRRREQSMLMTGSHARRKHRYPTIDANMAATVVPDRQWMGLYWRIYDAIQLRISPVQTKAAGLEIERRESGRGGAGTWCCVWHAHIRLMDYLLATEIVSHRDCGRQGVIYFFFAFFLLLTHDEIKAQTICKLAILTVRAVRFKTTVS